VNDLIEQWQTRAQREADLHARHACKRAVKKVTPTDEEARALYELYAEHESDIREWCKDALTKAQGEDAPPVGLEDLMAESYVLFQRSLVRYDPEQSSLRTYLQHDLRGRIRDYLRSVSRQTAEREEQRPDEASAAPKFHLDELYAELVDEGRVPAEVARIYKRLHPEKG
jgi:DNA-directed RNA polymerase specialized sigma24 family protein